MQIYAPITKIDAEQRMVWGYASTEARDDQGEIVQRAALVAAMPEWFKLGNIREMHQLSAVGKAKEATFDDKGLFIGAKIVDPVAWDKIINQVYNGFSIGGRVTKRDSLDRSVITGISLSEISVVDRPANPEALFDVWKASDGGMADAIGTIADTPAGDVLKALAEPVQIWACGAPGHQHTAKAEAAACIEKRAAEGAAAAEDELRKAEEAVERGEIDVEPAAADAESGPDSGAAKVAKVLEQTVTAPELAEKARDDKPKGDYGSVTYADPGHQADKKPRKPLDTADDIRDAWHYINKPKHARKYSSFALTAIKAKIGAAWKDKINPDGPPSAQSSKKAARSFINSLVAEEQDIQLMNKMTKGQEAGHQMGLDVAAMASKRAMGYAAKKSDRKCANNFCKTVLDAGACDLGAGDREMLTNSHPMNGAAAATNHATQDTGHRETTVPNPTGKSPESAVPPTTSMKAAATAAYIEGQLSELSKAAPTAAMTPYQKLMMIAHDSIKSLSGGATCKAGTKPDYLTRSQMDDLDTAHYHFGKGRGLKCDMAATAKASGDADDETATTDDAEGSVAKAVASEDELNKLDLPAVLAKALQDQNERFAAQSEEMVKAVAGLAEQLGATRQRVEDIARQEMPPLTIAKGTVITEKGGPEGGMSAEDFAAAVAKMTPEEIQMTSLKGTFLNGPDERLTARFGGRIIR